MNQFSPSTIPIWDNSWYFNPSIHLFHFYFIFNPRSQYYRKREEVLTEKVVKLHISSSWDVWLVSARLWNIWDSRLLVLRGFNYCKLEGQNVQLTNLLWLCYLFFFFNFLVYLEIMEQLCLHLHLFPEE